MAEGKYTQLSTEEVVFVSFVHQYKHHPVRRTFMQVTAFDLRAPETEEVRLNLYGPVTPWACIAVDCSECWDFRIYGQNEGPWAPNEVTELPIFLRTRHPTRTTGKARLWTAMITNVTETVTEEGTPEFILRGTGTLDTYSGRKTFFFSQCEGLQVHARGTETDPIRHFSQLKTGLPVSLTDC